MTSRQKAKGNQFERQVASHLSEVFELNFERVPNSGAFTGGKNIHRYNTLTEAQKLIYDGDILMPEELGNFKIECKSYKDFAFHGLFKTNALINSWIDQAKVDFKLWFLIFKINNRGSFIAFDRVVWKSINYQGNYMNYNSCYIVNYDGFFEKNKNVLLKMSSKYTNTNYDG